KAPVLKQVCGFLVGILGIVMITAPEAAGTSQAGAVPPIFHPWPTLLLVGVGVGFLSGLLGVGGGTLMVPALVFLLGQRQHAAQGIALAAIIPVSISGG